jgi:hypothetical protein
MSPSKQPEQPAAERLCATIFRFRFIFLQQEREMRRIERKRKRKRLEARRISTIC